ncbi:Medium-wave-sensitive opsin 1 [Holothuria leucospilota]|uniref:Medium-wave-sensitive opsin 1 n=1 Tax=Holothuria leucospilota TaxID=206669 RepID=A0A9Q1CAL9_HOLLE|nr:Medium-wave-sensitive opsin 1 [Holothuria leucospilota]
MNNTIFETIQYPHRLCMYLTIVDYTKTPRQLFHITLWLSLIICGYTTNGLFMFTILKSQTLRRSVMNRLLLVLSVIDIFILTNELVYIVYPFFARDVPWKDAFQTPLVVGPVWFYSLCEHFSEGVLIVIAYERFRAICFPFHNLKKGSFLIKSVSIVVIVSILFTAVYAYMFYFGDSNVLHIFLVFFLVAPSLVPFLISAILYTCVIYTTYTSAQGVVTQDKKITTKMKKNRRQVIAVLFVNTFVYFALNALRKYFDTRLAQAFEDNSNENPGHSQYTFIGNAWHWASYMALCMILNSTVNPIIYNMGSYQYRQAMFRSVYCFRPLRRGSFHSMRTINHSKTLTTISEIETRKTEGPLETFT